MLICSSVISWRRNTKMSIMVNMAFFARYNKCVGLLLFLMFFCVPLMSCTKFDSLVVPVSVECVEEVPSPIEYIESNEVLERAYQMASMEWIPLNPVPKRGGGHYSAGVKVRGVPYSSVKEINTYLFQDVSYYTFMTAVHNPYSVLYTEDISKAPYHGKNCAPYYGAVCSSSVMWVLGIDIPYYANQIADLPDMKPIEDQIIDSLRICDVIWKNGHVQMIYDMVYQADTLYRISTFETSGKSSHISEYSKGGFQEMWDKGGYVGYRYEKMHYSTTPPVISGFNPITYNEDLCPSKGDKSVYRTTDTVTVNIFNPNYETIVLSKGSEIISSVRIVGDYQRYFNLTPGIYTVALQNSKGRTSTASFEILETNVNCHHGEGKDVTIDFNSSATAVYVALCDKQGVSECYPISALDRMRGSITVHPIDKSELYCKVIFKGEYGRIINEPIRVE